MCTHFAWHDIALNRFNCIALVHNYWFVNKWSEIEILRLIFFFSFKYSFYLNFVVIKLFDEFCSCLWNALHSNQNRFFFVLEHRITFYDRIHKFTLFDGDAWICPQKINGFDFERMNWMPIEIKIHRRKKNQQKQTKPTAK